MHPPQPATGNPTQVAGFDAWRGGWVGVVLDNGRVDRVVCGASLRELLGALSAMVVGVDIPIGFATHSAPRRADRDARAFVGRRASSVFEVPPREVLLAASYAEARRLARREWGRGVSAQSYALRNRALEVDEICRAGVRLYEVHPEVTFRAMAGEPLVHPKRSWNGQQLRLGLLASQGIVLPDVLIEEVPADDVIDSAAVAWTAGRIAAGGASHLPADADPNEEPVIWY
jgi:predicted RNase H-like nuclease